MSGQRRTDGGDEATPTRRALALTLLILRPVNDHHHLRVEEIHIKQIERHGFLASFLRGPALQYRDFDRRNTRQSAQTLLQPDNTH